MSDVIKTAHDVLDAAKVFAADSTHPQLVERIKLLVAERDRLRAENATLRKIIRDAHYSLIDEELAKGIE